MHVQNRNEVLFYTNQCFLVGFTPLTLSLSICRLLCLRLHGYVAGTFHMCESVCTFLIQFDVINIFSFFFFNLLFCLFCCLYLFVWAGVCTNSRIHTPLQAPWVHCSVFGIQIDHVVRCTCKLQTNRCLLVQSISHFQRGRRRRRWQQRAPDSFQFCAQWPTIIAFVFAYDFCFLFSLPLFRYFGVI